MPEALQFVCYLLGFICFVLAAFVGDRLFARRPINLVALGLAFWIAVSLWFSLEALN